MRIHFLTFVGKSPKSLDHDGNYRGYPYPHMNQGYDGKGTQELDVRIDVGSENGWHHYGKDGYEGDDCGCG